MEKKDYFWSRSLKIIFYRVFSSSIVTYTNLLAAASLCCGGSSNSVWARRTIVFKKIKLWTFRFSTPRQSQPSLGELKNILFFQKITILEITGCFAFLRAPGVFRITYWVYTNIVKAFKPSVSDFCWLWVHLPPFSVYTHLYLPLRSQSQIPPIFQKNHDFEDCMPLGESLTGVDCFKPLKEEGLRSSHKGLHWKFIFR